MFGYVGVDREHPKNDEWNHEVKVAMEKKEMLRRCMEAFKANKRRFKSCIYHSRMERIIKKDE